MARKRKIRKTKRPLVDDCFFCKSGQVPDYKKVDQLRRFLSDRGKIVSRGRSGVCAKHQRKLSREIERARHLSLLPFVVRI
jgi:small subunit ribosomal protein S18